MCECVCVCMCGVCVTYKQREPALLWHCWFADLLLCVALLYVVLEFCMLTCLFERTLIGVHAVIKVIEKKYIVHPLAITAPAQSWVGHLQVIWQPWNDSISNTLEWQLIMEVYMYRHAKHMHGSHSSRPTYIRLCMGLLSSTE